MGSIFLFCPTWELRRKELNRSHRGVEGVEMVLSEVPADEGVNACLRYTVF
jgi:hypothetical protein